MEQQTPYAERRSEARKATERYYSVQFSIRELSFRYQFKLWNISSQGLCILVKKESAVLDHVHEGDIIDVDYYLVGGNGTLENRRTQIKHITPNDNGRFRGHCLVGLAIVDG